MGMGMGSVSQRMLVAQASSQRMLVAQPKCCLLLQWQHPHGGRATGVCLPTQDHS